MEFHFYANRVWKHWLALMSCAAFTFIGFYVAYASKSNAWTVRAIFCAALVFLFIAGFLAWRDEHRELIKAETGLADLRQHLKSVAVPNIPASPVHVQISGLNQAATDGPPRLGMRVISLFDSVASGIVGATVMEVEFRVCLLTGR